MKRLFATMLFAVLTVCISAVTPLELLRKMPVDAFPYINKDNIDVLIHMYEESSDTATIQTVFETPSCLYGVNDNSCVMQMGEDYKLQIVSPSSADADSAFYVISTYSAPQLESIIYKVDFQWKCLQRIPLEFSADDFIADGVAEADKEKVRNAVEWFMCSAWYNQENDEVELSLSFPTLSKEEIEELKSFVQVKKLSFKYFE